MQFAILALAAFLGLQVAVEQSDAWVPFNKHSELALDAINFMLVENEPDDSIEANMALIKQAYEKKSREGSNSFVKTLGELAGLDTILSPERCDRKSYELLKELDLGTGGVNSPARRVNEIVKKYTIEHAKICYDVLPELVNATKKSVSEENLKYVIRMADAVDTHFTWHRGCSLLERSTEDEMFQKFPILYVMMQLAATDPDSRFLKLVADSATGDKHLRKDKVKGLYNKYFYEPCKEFEEKVGEEYFERIRFDIEFCNDAGYESMCKNIYLDSLAMKICHQLIDDKKFRKSSLNFLLKRIKDSNQ